MQLGNRYIIGRRYPVPVGLFQRQDTSTRHATSHQSLPFCLWSYWPLAYALRAPYGYDERVPNYQQVIVIRKKKEKCVAVIDSLLYYYRNGYEYTIKIQLTNGTYLSIMCIYVRAHSTTNYVHMYDLYNLYVLIVRVSEYRDSFTYD